MRFTFIHAADLHIDSPLDALGAKDAEVAKLFREAGREAVRALVDETVSSGAAFLVIAGDVFDGDWKDQSTGLFFARELGRLAQAGIPVFLIKGNHDAESVVTKSLPALNGLHVFGTRKAETHKLPELQVALHGRSYPHRQPPEGFVASYPKPEAGWLNIGILHTGLDGSYGDHAPYAPCSVAQLQGFGYDYWALGHIHQPQKVSESPWIVFPGNIQGRNVRETGPRGAMRVSVNNRRIEAVEPVVLDRARWAHERVDVSACTAPEAIEQLIDVEIAKAQAGAQERPVALRITLDGTAPLHTHLVAAHEALLEAARLRAAGFAAGVWIERLRLETRPVPAIRRLAEADSLDVAALLDKALDEPEFALALEAALVLITGKIPITLEAAEVQDRAALKAQLAEQARDLLLGRLSAAAEERA